MAQKRTNRNILFLDDEPNITELFIKSFKEKFEITTVNDPNQALRILRNDEFAVVISDYHMPKMNGMDFLRVVMEKNPQTRRILVSGNIDKNLIVESLKTARIHLVILKPWDVKELKEEIERHIQEYNLQNAFRNEYNYMKEKLEKQPNLISKHTDGLLDMLSHLNTVDNIQDFANQFVNAIEGMKSLAYLNTELYLEKSDSDIFRHVLEYVYDIEVIANCYCGNRF